MPIHTMYEKYKLGQSMEPLQSERLIIREFHSNDWEDLYEYLSDEEVIKFEPYEVFTKEQAMKEALRREHDRTFFAVCLKETNKLIGNLYLAKGDFETWEFGYVFNKTYQGQGYATESAKVLIDYAFTNLDVRRITACCNPKNDASWILLERLHFRREGLQLQNIYFKKNPEGNPIWLDTYMYALLQSEWLIVKSTYGED